MREKKILTCWHLCDAAETERTVEVVVVALQLPTRAFYWTDQKDLNLHEDRSKKFYLAITECSKMKNVGWIWLDLVLGLGSCKRAVVNPAR